MIHTGCRKNEIVNTACFTGLDISYSMRHNQYNAATFTSNAIYDFNSYTWSFGDGSSSNDLSPTHIYPATNATYTVHFSGKNNCGSIISKDTTIVICSSCFTFKPIVDSLVYTITLTGYPTVAVAVGGINSDTFINGKRLLIYSGDQFLSIYDDVTGVRNVDLGFGDTLNKSIYGYPNIGNYYRSTSTLSSSYGIKYGSSIYQGYAYAGSNLSSLTITRSDSVITGGFDILYTPASTSNIQSNSHMIGHFIISSYKYYY